MKKKATVINPPTEQRAIVRNAFWDLFLVNNTSLTGVTVTADTALTSPAIFCAVSVLSHDLASLPVITYERTQAGRIRAEGHPVYSILKDQPNDLYVSIQSLKKVLWTNVFTYGNGYLLIIRTGAGRPSQLVNVHPNRVRIVQSDTGYYYRIDEERNIMPGDMVHIRFHSEDTITSKSPISIGRNTIGLALALDQFAASFFGNGARPSGIIVSEAPLSDQARANLAKSWRESYAGVANTGKTPVLEQGLSYVPPSIPQNEAQFNETRSAVMIDIARLFNLPPHKLKELGRATWGNLSSESLSYVRDSIRPWTIQLEEELQLKLFTPAERSTYYIEHCFKDLLRADDMTRHQVYQIGVQTGFYTVDEIREWENLNPLPAPLHTDNGNSHNQSDDISNG